MRKVPLRFDFHPPRRARESLSETGGGWYPEEDVLGGVEASSVDPGGEGRVPLADDAAGEAGDGALEGGAIGRSLTPGHSVRHHKVNGVLRGTPDLGERERVKAREKISAAWWRDKCCSLFYIRDSFGI